MDNFEKVSLVNFSQCGEKPLILSRLVAPDRPSPPFLPLQSHKPEKVQSGYGSIVPGIKKNYSISSSFWYL